MYVTWDASDESGAVPRGVRAGLAVALCDVGLVVFMGGPGGVRPDCWRQTDEGWAAVSRSLLDPVSQRGRLRFVASRNAEIVETLFDQQGFDWTQRGQVAFVVEDVHDHPPKDSPNNFAACLKSDPPQCKLSGCIAMLRPGTDGDFAEFHTASEATAQRFESRLIQI